MAPKHAAGFRRIDTPLMRLIDRAGYRRSWFAREVLRVEKWTLSRVEAGLQRPPAGWYERAAGFLRVPVEDVLPEQEGVTKAA